MNKLGIRIKTLRLTKGLSQEELAEKIGVSSSSLNAWEGGRLPIARSIPKLARGLGVEASDLAELWVADSLENIKEKP